MSKEVKKTKKMSNWLKVVLVILVLLIAFFVFYLVFGNSNIRKIEKAIEKRDFVKAKGLLDKTLESKPNDKKIYMLYSDYYLEHNECLNAINILQEGEKKFPKEKMFKNRIEEIENNYSELIELEKDNQEMLKIEKRRYDEQQSQNEI